MEWIDDDEFQFALEMIILSRRENGATLTEIRGNFMHNFTFKVLHFEHMAINRII